MRSPFGIFRKHGTILTAGLIILCMFAFTLADFLRPEHLPILLGMAAFGLIFYLLGQPSGKGGWFGVVGALVGLVVLLLMPDLFQPEPAARTAVGNLSDRELDEKVDRRRAANQFMFRVYQVGMKPRPSVESLFADHPNLASNPQILQMVMPQILQQQRAWDRGFQNFGFASLEESPEYARAATVREWVMAQQADEIGIRVSNEAITQYLQKASHGRLSAEQFTELRKDLNMSEAELYDLLRYHIKARQYFWLTYPAAMTPPEQQWDFFKRASVKQDMDLAKIPVEAFLDQVEDPTDAELTAYYDQYKTRAPQGIITREDGWIEPVEIISPEPSFLVPQKIKLEYLTATVKSYEPTDAEIAKYYEEHAKDYPNPAYSRPFEPEDIPEPLTEGGPAVAQKPKKGHSPAWAEKQEFLTLHQAKTAIRGDIIFEAQQKARAANDKIVTQAVAMMNELGSAYAAQGEYRKEPTEISAQLKKFAEEHGLAYTVTEALTPEQMTETKVGKAVEVDINSNPLPGQMRASVRPGGANVVYLTFRGSNSEELYRPNQAISINEIDTRYVYWKIEDHPPQSPAWEDLTDEKRADVTKAWKMQKARDIAQKRATELQKAVEEYAAKQPKDAEPKDLAKIVEELKATVTGQENGREVLVTPAYGFQWIQPSQETGPRIGMVFGVPKAGVKFMEAAFHEFRDPGDVGVLVNADATEYYVGRLLDRRYGEGGSLESLREAFLNQTGTPALQTVSDLVFQENQELVQKWYQQFDEKFEIQVPEPETAEPAP